MAFVDDERLCLANSQAFFDQEDQQAINVDKFDSCRIFAGSFFARAFCECASSQKDTVLRTALYCTSKVANFLDLHGTRISLALKHDLDANKAFDEKETFAIDTVIASLACHFQVFEANVPKQARAKLLKSLVGHPA
jgi:hypothetical protein